MELIWFNWSTNPDYFDMLSREVFITDAMIKKSELKRLIAKRKRKLLSNK